MDREALLARVLSAPADFTDASTGLCGAPFFHAVLTREMARVRRTGDPMAVGVVRVDGAADPKPAGSRGESTGPALGTIIRSHIREIDLATDCGGGLYLVQFCGSRSESARSAAERIRAAVQGSGQGRTTVSVGLACFPDDGVETDLVITRAVDACLHAANAGGNRVFHFEKPAHSPSTAKARVLVVDDDARNLKLMCALLENQGFELVTATSGEQALEVVRDLDVDLLLLDVMMPGVDGFDVCRRIKGTEATRQIPVVLLTALADSESRLKGVEAGADDFISKPANREELLARTRSLIRVKRLNRDLVSLENALVSLANAVEAKDHYTLGHTQRVSTLAVAVGARLGLGDVELKGLRLGGILHDVGKIGVPEEVLNKPGPLSESEWVLMKSHAELGYKICLPLLESIGPALDVIRHHHEKLDGSSYPDGLKGSGVSRMARIMAVVDCYDAMVTDRPYRNGMPKEKALGILAQEVAQGRLDGEVLGVLESLVTGSRIGPDAPSQTG
ncbi:MAG TPA: HD domain-containing phosphohydrolase [Spirochaetia bacterium]|nr:HD domain-containing phosphohydrolase [Spirochaetia bacterium]